MIHGLCGHLNTQCPCIEGEPKKCHWNYPMQFQETTQQGDDSYPLYRQRDNGIEKNVFKYLYKGHDKQVVNVDKDGEQVVNEIKRFQDAHYVSPPEAMWRIYGFPLSNIYPFFMSLQVHLPNKQFVTFEEDIVLTDILENEKKRSMLIAFFELNQTNTEARQHLYKDIPKFYTWNKSARKWNRQKQGKMRGRIVSANPAEGERFYLRVLLQHLKGPSGFDYLYTINDVLCNTPKNVSQQK
ncbi:hypothetical protein Tco_0735384 [Tanacetum coccineum]